MLNRSSFVESFHSQHSDVGDEVDTDRKESTPRKVGFSQPHEEVNPTSTSKMMMPRTSKVNTSMSDVASFGRRNSTSNSATKRKDTYGDAR